MKLNAFKLEEYLARYEFKAPYLLCCSDAESWSLSEILAMANAQEHELWNNLRLGYTEVPGLPLLRETIAQTMYPNLQAENIFCFAGAEEGIFCGLSALCGPGEHVIVVTPCYQSLMEIPRAQGCHISTLNLTEEKGWRLDIEAVERLIQSNTKWLVINFPHNPTGQILAADDLQRLLALLAQHDLGLYSDEVYRLLGPAQNWVKPAACLYSMAVSLGVMSKAYGLAGLRVGWIACQDKEILKKIELFKQYTSICNSAPSEILSIIALRNQEHILARNNNIIKANLALLDDFMEEYYEHFS